MKKRLLLIPAAIMIILMFVPVPALVIDVLLGISYAVIAGIIIAVYIRGNTWTTLPKTLYYLLVIVLCICVSSTRTILVAKNFSEQNPLLQLIFFLNTNSVLNIVISVCVLIATVISIRRNCTRISEVNARFIVDRMNQKFFNIDYCLNNNEITEEEAEQRKEFVTKEIEYYSNLDLCSKFLVGSGYFLMTSFLVVVVGGLLTGIFLYGYDVKEAFSVYSFFGLFSTAAFVIPVLFLAFAANYVLNMNFKKIEKENPEETYIIIDEFICEIGNGLIFLTDTHNSSQNLMSKINKLRKELPDLPKIRIMDNSSLKNRECRIHWENVEMNFVFNDSATTDEMLEKISQMITEVFKKHGTKRF